MEDNKAFYKSDDILSLIKRYDKNMDGEVSFKEFKYELIPKTIWKNIYFLLQGLQSFFFIKTNSN